jgi:hypothetical protein
VRNVQMIRRELGPIWTLAAGKAVDCDYCETGSTSAERLCGALGIRAERPIGFSDRCSGRFAPGSWFGVGRLVTTSKQFST